MPSTSLVALNCQPYLASSARSAAATASGEVATSPFPRYFDALVLTRPRMSQTCTSTDGLRNSRRVFHALSPVVNT